MYDSVLSEIHERWFDNVAKAASRHVKSLIHPRKKIAILDLGCGGGTLLYELSQICSSCYGSDISSQMLSIARKRMPKANLECAGIFEATIPRVDVVTMVGEILSYASANSESNNVMINDLFSEIHSSLSPGGFFLFDVLGSEYNYKGITFHDTDDWTVFSEVTQNGFRVTRKIVSFLKTGDCYIKSIENHDLRTFDEDFLCSILSDVGFKFQKIEKYHDMTVLPGRIAFECQKLA